MFQRTTVFFQTFVEVLPVIAVAALDAHHVIVGLQLGAGLFQHGNGQIGSVVGNAFKIVDAVVKDKAQLQRALTGLQTLNMPGF